MFFGNALTIARRVAAGAALALLLAPPTGHASHNEPPRAGFEFSPAYPVPGDAVTFTSTSTDSDDDIAAVAWDLNGDGTDDVKGSPDEAGTVTHVYPERGVYRVRLRVWDDDGPPSTWYRRVTVNHAPAASFDLSPANPSVSETVTFTSSSSDQDGSITSESWDLNGDGAFGDATGPVATAAYDTPGSRRVSLRVTDDLGSTSTWSLDFNVAAGVRQPATGAGGSAPAPAAGPSWMSPFPTVRIAGRAVRGGARLSLMAVRAVPGASVEVRCAGRACPARVRRARVARAGRVRVHAFERFLRAGTVLSVRVTKKGHVGKYTRFRIRSRKAPTRWDGCLMPGRSRPVECPSS